MKSTLAEYCSAYRRAGNMPQRQRQIFLIVEIGHALDDLVRKPFIRTALAMFTMSCGATRTSVSGPGAVIPPPGSRYRGGGP